MTCHTLWLYDQSTTSLLQIGLCVAIKDHHCQQVDVYIVRCSPTSPCLSARYQSGLVPSGPTGGTLCSLQASQRQCLTPSFEFFAKLFDDKITFSFSFARIELKSYLSSNPVWSVPSHSQSQDFSIFLDYSKNQKYQYHHEKTFTCLKLHLHAVYTIYNSICFTLLLTAIKGLADFPAVFF